MAEQEAVKRFLMDVVGYGRVMQLLEGEKPLDERVVDFLSGTVFGTFDNDSAPYDAGKWDFPIIPPITPARRNDFGCEVNTTGMFRGWAPESIAEFVKEFANEIPEAHLPKNNLTREEKAKGNYFSVKLDGKGMYVSVSGYQGGIEQRAFSAFFNLPVKVVEGINKAVADYIVVRGMPFPESLKIFSKKPYRSYLTSLLLTLLYLSSLKEVKTESF